MPLKGCRRLEDKEEIAASSAGKLQNQRHERKHCQRLWKKEEFEESAVPQISENIRIQALKEEAVNIQEKGRY